LSPWESGQALAGAALTMVDNAGEVAVVRRDPGSQHREDISTLGRAHHTHYLTNLVNI